MKPYIKGSLRWYDKILAVPFIITVGIVMGTALTIGAILDLLNE